MTFAEKTAPESSVSALPVQRWWSVVLALVVVLGLLCVRTWYLTITHMDLAPDEAQYWVWSKELQLSYYSKPPLVAWLIHASTQVFGDTLLGVRAFALLGTAVLSFAGFLMVRRWRGDGAGWLALLTLNAVPLIGVGGMLMSPDVPMVVLVVLALLCLNGDWQRRSWLRFVAVGLLVGLAGLAKYTAAVFYPLLGLYLLVHKDVRMWLWRPHIWVAGGVSLAVVSPVLWWNMQHDFVGFQHVFGQLGAERTNWEPAKTFGNFWEGQLGVLGLVLLFMLVAWMRGPATAQQDDDGRLHHGGRLLWWFSFVLFVAFMLKSIDAKVQPNWPVLATVTGMLMLCGWLVTQPGWVKKLYLAALIVMGSITLIAHNTFMVRETGIDWPIRKDPTKETLGWRGIGAIVRHQLNRMPPETVVLSTRYQTTAQLLFYARDVQGDIPNVLYANPGYRRQNHFDYSDWPADIARRPVLYVNEQPTLEAVVVNAFNSCQPMPAAAAVYGNIPLRSIFMWICTDYKGLERLKADSY